MFLAGRAPAVKGEIAPFFAPNVQRWSADIVRWSAEHDLDPNLVATVMQIESCGQSRAVSVAGASGLFQVMPFHFQTGEDHFNPETNAKRGLNYLAGAVERADGSVTLALAGYNGGYGTMRKPYDQWPTETQRYVYWGAGIYEDAQAGLAESARLQEWLRAGGAGLCDR
jgi:soluble lytic murein transglycosylase-like protein